ncbi:MAG: hypothetical protein ABEJ03_03555, partial [Candidatus Nanohaloarchaea archaeon]
MDETGDSMTGYLNMTGSDIKNVGTINASAIQESGTEIGQVYVDESGDAMSGSLNLQSNDLRRVDELRTTGGGSDVIAVRDVANSQDIARFKEGGSVEIPNGRQQIMYDAGNNVADGSLILSGTSTASDENPSLSFWLRPEDNLHGGISLISKSFGTYGAELQVKGKRGNGGVDAPFTINPKYGITTQGDQGEFTVYDDANDQYIARFKEGGNLKVPNGNFNVSGGDAEFQGSISTDSSAPHEIRIHSGNKGSFMDTQKNDVYVTDGSHPAYSDWGNLVFEAPSNKGSIVFATSNKSGGGGSVQSTLEVQEQGAVEIPNGNLNVEGSGRFNSLRGDSSGNKCGVNEFLNGNGNCQKDSNTDTDNQDLSDVLAQGERTGNQDIDLDGAELIDREGSITLGGGNVEVPGGNLDVSGNDINLNGGDILTGSGQTSQIRAVRSFSIDIDTDNNENDRVFRIQKDGLSTDLLVVRENGKVQVPNGNLDISSPYYTGSTLDVGGGANFGNSVNLNNNDLGGANVISFNDAGTDGKIEFGSGAKIYNAPLDDSNSAGYLQLVNDEGIAFEAGSDGTQTMELKSNNNVEIPNGNLDISNSDGGSIKLGGEFDEEIAFTEGSDTNTFGDIDFPDVSSSNAYIRFFRDTSTTGTAQFKVYKGDGTNTVNFAVNDNNNGNVEVPNGNLKLNHNKIENVGELNVSTSTEQIAHFSDTGVTLKQPLSVESSGPLSVSNGIELTGTSSNTISSYSTFYLETQSGSPSDIVLNPTGEVGIDANASIAGDLNMNGNDIKTGGGTVAIRDSTNGQDVLRAKEGGNIEVPNGDLDVGGEAQIGQYVSGWMLLKNQGVGDAGHALSQNSNGKTLLNSADGQPILLKNSDSTILARLNSNGDI